MNLTITPGRKYVLAQVEKRPGIRQGDQRLQGGASIATVTLLETGYLAKRGQGLHLTDKGLAALGGAR